MPPPIYFAISLKPKIVSNDWPMVEENLRNTLRSILGSTNLNYRIVVACHDEPDVDNLPRGRIDLVRAPFPPETEVLLGAIDKTRKRRLAAAWIRGNLEAEGLEDCYIMILDADDLVSNQLVARVMEKDNRLGYIITTGYQFDFMSNRLSICHEDFDRRCGSCYIGYFKIGELPCQWDDPGGYFYQFKRHRTFAEVAALWGRTPVLIPFPAVVYVINHPESLQTLRQNGALRVPDVRQMVDRHEGVRLLRDEFSFDPPSGHCT